MTDIPVFVNGQFHSVPTGTDVAGAVTRHDTALGEKLARAEAYATSSPAEGRASAPVHSLPS